MKHAYGDLYAHDDGSINEYQPGYFALHGNPAAIDFSDIEPGDTIIVDGTTYYIEGYVDFQSGSPYTDLRDQLGWDRALFSSCYGSDNYARLLYSSPCGDYSEYVDGDSVWHDHDQELERGYTQADLEAEYRQLISEQGEIDAEKAIVDALAENVETQEDSNEYNRRCWEYEKRVADYNARVADYETRKAA